MTARVSTRASPSHVLEGSGAPEWWALFLWRLPTGSSTPRVTVWRQLRRLGAARLTPGAALLPWRDDLVEQLDWLAQEVDDQHGDAWVMRVSDLSKDEQRRVIDHVNHDLTAEYAGIRRAAERFVSGSDRELLALQRRLRKVRNRDHFGAPGRREAAAAVDRCLRQAKSLGSRVER